MGITIIIIAITAIVSIAAFNNVDLLNKLVLWPRQMNSPAEYYRFITSGFIHNDWNHLLFNMFALYCFGSNVENGLGVGAGLFVFIYLTGIVISSVPSFIKNRNNSYYRSLGASGGVSTIVFLTIYYFPWSRISLMFIPIGIPAVIFAVLYLIYSVVMSKRGTGNINHDAHIWGSVYGIVIAVIIDPSHGLSFIDQLSHPH
jgi:membrane associated rhomboid family serine protease